MKCWLRRLARFVMVCFCLLVMLIVVEVIAGWRCNLQGNIPAPAPPSKDRQTLVAGIKGYSRPEDDAYLSLPEWYIVWSYQEKADFQKANLPSAFPYFAAVRQYWGNYCCISRLTSGKYAFNFGEHVMLVVIGTSFSAEYTLKGVYEKTIGRISEWTSGRQFTEEDIYSNKVASDYAEFVHVRPFYEFQFARHVKGLWTVNPIWGAHPLRKWERRVFLTADYTIEAFYCWLIDKATHLSYGYESDQTYAWIDTVDSSLDRIPHVKIVKPVGQHAYIIEAPRYQPFTDVALSLTLQGTHFVEIAGNSSITISTLAPDSTSEEIQMAQPLFSLPLLTRPGWRRIVLRCDVPELGSALRDLIWSRETAKGVEVEHVYDY